MLGLVEPSGCRLSREELTNYMSLLCRSKLNFEAMMMIMILVMIRIIRYDDDQDQNHGEDHLALADDFEAIVWI